MTFGKNVQREQLLLSNWRLGYTIEQTSLVTSIPAGSIGYYFKKFNKNPEKYRKVVDGVFQDPPKFEPHTVALANVTWAKIFENVKILLSQGRYGDARDYLECSLLIGDLYKRLSPMMYNFDLKDLQEIVEDIAVINKLNSAPPGSTNAPTVEPQSTLETNMNLSNSKTLSTINDKPDNRVDPKNLKWNTFKGRYDDTSYSFDKASEKMEQELKKKGFVPI